MGTYRKDDVEFHGLGHGHQRVPAVNVKVYDYADDAMFRRVATDEVHDPERVSAWWEGLDDRERDAIYSDAFAFACERGWEDLETEACEIFGPGTKVYSEGRSGGWAYVHGIDADDVDGWDAIALARWARFARIARILADDIPYQVAWSIIVNVYEPTDEEQRRLLNGPTSPSLIGATA